MERFYRVFRYRSDDVQHDAPGTGVTIRDDIRSADYADAYRDGYLAACVGCGWDDYDQHCGCNPAGEVWVFRYESYPVSQCRQCGAYVSAWWMDKHEQPWCVGCLGEAKLDKAEVDFVRGIWERMVRARDEHGPYIGNWPTDWETREGEMEPAAVPVCVEVVGTITLERTVTVSDLCDVLCTAFDGAYGGSNYWVDKHEVQDHTDRGEYWWEQVAYGGSVRIYADDETRLLTQGKLLKGIERAAREGRLQIREEWTSDVDVEVADVIIQYALFDAIIYG